MTEFYLKGDRDYLHGTTIFDHIISSHCPTPPTKIDFLIHRLTKMTCSVEPWPINDLNRSNIIGEFKSDQGKLAIYESDQEVTVKRPYDEERMQQQCVIEQQCISIPETIEDFSVIEKIIGAYKHLLIHLLKEEHGKFLFARILLDELPASAISIKHDRIISRKYFQGTVRQNDIKIGTIFFGVNQ